MPRQKQPSQRVQVFAELLEDREPAPLAIPVPHKDHEHRIDPYKTLPGAMPDPTPTKRGRGRPRKDDIAAAKRAEDRRRQERYSRYLDALIASQGDTDCALAVVYGLNSVQEAVDRHDELLADVQAGIPSSSINDMLKGRDLDKAARVSILRKHAYSSNPAASLKALDMIQDLDGSGPSESGWETYIRLAMSDG